MFCTFKQRLHVLVKAVRAYDQLQIMRLSKQNRLRSNSLISKILALSLNLEERRVLM